METKIKAAEIVVTANASMIIAEGSKPNIINDILEGKEIRYVVSMQYKCYKYTIEYYTSL